MSTQWRNPSSPFSFYGDVPLTHHAGKIYTLVLTQGIFILGTDYEIKEFTSMYTVFFMGACTAYAAITWLVQARFESS